MVIKTKYANLCHVYDFLCYNPIQTSPSPPPLLYPKSIKVTTI